MLLGDALEHTYGILGAIRWMSGRSQSFRYYNLPNLWDGRHPEDELASGPWKGRRQDVNVQYGKSDKTFILR